MINIAIMGAYGSMGKRYRAILSHLDVGYSLFDIDTWGQVATTVGIDGIIICSPTKEHVYNLREVKRLNVPVLCEKPVSIDKTELDIMLEYEKLTMVNQYAFISGVAGEGPSYYDYYNSGNDGIHWDTINIIGLAKGDCYINNKSPIWKCMINGKKLTLEDVNQSYIDMVKSWIKYPKENRDYIRECHKRIWDGKYKIGSYRHTSKDDQHKTPEKVHDGNQRKADARMGDKSSPKVSNVFKPRT